LLHAQTQINYHAYKHNNTLAMSIFCLYVTITKTQNNTWIYSIIIWKKFCKKKTKTFETTH